MQTFTVPFKLDGRNDYINKCKSRKGYPAQTYKKDIEQGILLCIKSRKVRKAKRPIFVTFTWYEQTRGRDKDNVAFAKKFILDAMKKRIMPDDGNRYLLGFADRFVYGQGQKVVVTIEEADEVGGDFDGLE